MLKETPLPINRWIDPRKEYYEKHDAGFTIESIHKYGGECSGSNISDEKDPEV